MVFSPGARAYAGRYKFTLRRGDLWAIVAEGEYSLREAGGLLLLSLKPTNASIPASVERWERQIIINTGIIISEESEYAVCPTNYPADRRMTVRLCNTELRAGTIRPCQPGNAGCPDAWQLQHDY